MTAPATKKIILFKHSQLQLFIYSSHNFRKSFLLVCYSIIFNNSRNFLPSFSPRVKKHTATTHTRCINSFLTSHCWCERVRTAIQTITIRDTMLNEPHFTNDHNYYLSHYSVLRTCTFRTINVIIYPWFYGILFFFSFWELIGANELQNGSAGSFNRY